MGYILHHVLTSSPWLKLLKAITITFYNMSLLDNPQRHVEVRRQTFYNMPLLDNPQRHVEVRRGGLK
jgi:hypothetical protein